MDAVQKANAGIRARRWRWRRSRTCSTASSCAPTRPTRTGPTATASCSRPATRGCCSTRPCTCGLRPAARRAQALPPVGLADAGPPRALHDARGRDDDRAARPGLRQRASGWRWPSASCASATAAGHVVRPPHLRDLLRRRPDGGRRVRGARRSPAHLGARPARLPLRRQPDHDRRPDRALASTPRTSGRASRPTAGTSQHVDDVNDLEALERRDPRRRWPRTSARR